MTCTKKNACQKKKLWISIPRQPNDEWQNWKKKTI
jgi:hypothetical protein